MNLTGRISEAFSSPPETVESFEHLKNIREMTVYKGLKNLGVGRVGTLPYGAGTIVEINGRHFYADSHTPFNGEGVRLAPKGVFAHDKHPTWPITVKNSD